MTDDQIRDYLSDRYGVAPEYIKTGLEADDEAAGLYQGEGDAWVIYGAMPNCGEIGWFFAGYSTDFDRD